MLDTEREQERDNLDTRTKPEETMFCTLLRLCTGDQTLPLLLVLRQPSRLLELRKHRNQPDLHTRAPQLYAPLVALTTAAADFGPLTVPPLPQVAVEWLVAGDVYCLNL